MPKQANRILLGNFSNLADRRKSSKASILKIETEIQPPLYSENKIEVKGMLKQANFEMGST